MLPRMVSMAFGWQRYIAEKKALCPGTTPHDAGHGFWKGPGLWECSGHVGTAYQPPALLGNETKLPKATKTSSLLKQKAILVQIGGTMKIDPSHLKTRIKLDCCSRVPLKISGFLKEGTMGFAVRIFRYFLRWVPREKNLRRPWRRLLSSFDFMTTDFVKLAATFLHGSESKFSKKGFYTVGEVP